MKHFAAAFIFPLLLLLFFQSCNDNSVARQQLADADSLIMVQPDSAVTLLASINTSRLNEHNQAYHALLLTKAMSKVPITTGSDSLIAIAADYFYGSGDSLEVQALYYQGEPHRGMDIKSKLSSPYMTHMKKPLLSMTISSQP